MYILAAARLDPRKRNEASVSFTVATGIRRTMLLFPAALRIGSNSRSRVQSEMEGRPRRLGNAQEKSYEHASRMQEFRSRRASRDRDRIWSHRRAHCSRDDIGLDASRRSNEHRLQRNQLGDKIALGEAQSSVRGARSLPERGFPRLPPSVDRHNSGVRSSAPPARAFFELPNARHALEPREAGRSDRSSV